MIGELVPLVMLPRFSSFLGEGTYRTVALDVSDYSGATMEFWRGKLRSPVHGSFTAYLEEAPDASDEDAQWTNLATVTTANGSTLVTVPSFSRRYFRIRIVLTDSTDHAVGITCWAAGSLQKRLPPRGR